MKQAVPFFSPVVFNLAKNGPYTKAINQQYPNYYFDLCQI